MAQSGDGAVLRIDGQSMTFDAMTAGDLAGASFRFAGGDVGSAPLAAPATGGSPSSADLDPTPQSHHRWAPIRDWWVANHEMVRTPLVRSDARRGGNEFVFTCTCRWSALHYI